jgi:hypothetical protein
MRAYVLVFVTAAVTACGEPVGVGGPFDTLADAHGGDATDGGTDGRVFATGPEAGGGDPEAGADDDGPLPACTWPTPTVPPNDSPVEVAADRTVIFCGAGDNNNAIRLSASDTEWTPEKIYGPCVYQCSPCMSLCKPDEYGIAVGMPVYSQLPPDAGLPYKSPTLPSTCRASFQRSPSGAVGEGGVTSLEWDYYCCPCD